MTPPLVRVSPDWLDLREPADAAARAVELADVLRTRLPSDGLVVHDLGSGTGATTRWLAPRLPGPQSWVLHDLDPDLLELAVERTAGVAAADGSAVRIRTQDSDVTRLEPEDLAGADLLTASALLDILTDEELRRLVAACTAVGCPTLLTLTVVGQVRLVPGDPLDEAVAAAFDAHQGRPRGDGRLLGPDAVEVAARLFRSAGADVLVRASPWRLGPADAALAEAWLTGWVAAACEQAPDLRPELDHYVRRRVDEVRAGAVQVVVGHGDLLALPRAPEPLR